MRLMTIAFLAAAFEWTTPPAAAQPVLALSSFSISSDLNDQVFPGVAGGILLDFAHSWSSVGVHGDVFFSGVMPPAVAVRSDRSISFGTGPFGSSPLEGMRGESWRGQCWAAAFELWGHRRIGLRASVQDYLVRVQGFDCGVLRNGPAYV